MNQPYIYCAEGNIIKARVMIKEFKKNFQYEVFVNGGKPYKENLLLYKDIIKVLTELQSEVGETIEELKKYEEN